MKLLLSLKKFYKIPIGFKKMVFQATCYSLWAEYDLHWNNFKHFKEYQPNRKETPLDTSEKRQQVIWVAKAMRMLEFKAPWTPMCLNRAVVAKRLLRAKGIETTLHIGFKPRNTKDEEFEGHVWLTIEGAFITGLVPHLAIYNEIRPIAS